MATNGVANANYQCSLCSNSFTDKKSYRSHVETCDLSDDESNKIQVNHHNIQNSSPPMNTKTSRNNLKKCILCNDTFDEDEYYSHMDNCGIQSCPSTEKKIVKKKKCQTCSLEIDEINYVDHVTQCGTKKSMKKCPTCSISIEEDQYADHVSDCTNVLKPEPSKTKKCQTCERDFHDYQFVEHVEQCNAKPQLKYKLCQSCDQKVPEKDFLDHIGQCEDKRVPKKTTKRKNSTEECPLCYQQFPIDQLEEHAGRCDGKSVKSNNIPSTASATSNTCFTCSTPINMSKSSSFTISCRVKHMYCIKCLQESMSKHLESNTPPVCNSNPCNYELSRYNIYCLPLNNEIINRLIPLVKSAQRPQCPLCLFYVDIKTMDDFNRHANGCIGDHIPCEYCHCLHNMQEIHDHTTLCRQTEQSTQQQAYLNFILSRTKYPMTIHELRVFLNERKKDHLSTDAHDIVNTLAELDGIFPYDIPTRVCDICAESFVYDDIFVFGCQENHKLCYDCFADSTANKMKNNEILACAMCNYQLPDGEIKELRIPAEQRRQYIDYQTNKTFSVYAGGQGILKCPNKSCKWMAELENPNNRLKITCPMCDHEFCSLCSQQYHFQTTCQEIPGLTQRWFFWCNTERGNYWQARAQQDVTYQTQLQDYERQRAANEQRNTELRQRYDELIADEQYKAQNCRLCPHCQRVVQHLSGCDLMTCGQNYHGGDKQSGCGQGFRWSQALPYQAVNTGPQQVENNIAAPEAQQTVVHEGVQCDACHNEIQGIRFDCIHCASLIFCEKCEQRATLEHSNQLRDQNRTQHVFKLITTPQNQTTN